MLRITLVCLGVSAAAQAAAARPSIAIAPFNTSSADAATGYGLAHDLSARLYGQPQVNVVSVRQVSAAARELGQGLGKLDATSAVRLGRQLGADLLVVGTLAKKKEALALTLTFYRPLTGGAAAGQKSLEGGALALEEAAAVEIATAAGVPQLGPPLTTKPLAAQALHRGLFALAGQSLGPNAADASVPSSLDASTLGLAATAFADAIAADPTLADAHAGLAVTRALGADFTGAQTALAEAKDGAFAVLADAFVAMRSGHFDDAQKILAAAVAKDPGFLHARGTLGQLYDHFGRFREARKEFAAYAEVAPAQPWARAQIGYALAKLHKYDEAIAVTESALGLVPDSPDLLVELASRLIDAGRYADAAKRLNEAQKLAPKDGRLLVRLGYVLLSQGDDAQAIKVTEKALKLLDATRERKELAYARLNLTRAWGHMGQYDVALEQLGLAKRAGLVDCAELEADAKLQRFRADPRYDKAKF